VNLVPCGCAQEKMMNNILEQAKERVFIIAELSANHGQKLETALDTVRAMKDSGADAVKLQTYTPDTMTLNVRNEHFTINHGTLWDGKNLYDLYKEAMTPWEWHEEIKELAEKLGMHFFSSPFDSTAVKFLSKLNVEAYKIASFEITDVQLIFEAAAHGKPMIISTGIASEEEIQDAVDACRNAGNNQIALLKCTSAYPAKIEDANLRALGAIAARFGCMVGLSDHSHGSELPVMAVPLGARIIEKHFILDRTVGGPDAQFSMTPEEFRKMAEAVRRAEIALGDGGFVLCESAQKNRKFARSLFVASDVKAGDLVTKENVRSVRPSAGLAPKLFKAVLGKKFNKDLKAGTPLSAEVLD